MQPASSGAKQSLVNLGITLGLFVSVMVLAIIFRKPSAHGDNEVVREVPKAVPVKKAVEVSQATPAITPTSSNTKAVKDRFEQLPSPSFVEEASTNEADTFVIRTGKDQYVFSLYFVDAAEATFDHQQRVREQATYFNKAPQEAIIETGRDALRFTSALLKERPFQVMTRWEQDQTTGRYLALLMVQQQNGEWTYLADLLVRQGFARVAGLTTSLPDNSRSLQDYLLELRNHAKYARERRLGIWSRLPKTS